MAEGNEPIPRKCNIKIRTSNVIASQTISADGFLDKDTGLTSSATRIGFIPMYGGGPDAVITNIYINSSTQHIHVTLTNVRPWQITFGSSSFVVFGEIYYE